MKIDKLHFKALVAFIILACCYTANISAQKYITKTGHATFISRTDALDIDGKNHQVAAIADISSGQFIVIVLIKAFEFTLATADKHFNETYMESDDYPKATFKGEIPMLKELDISKDGEYDATAEGILSIHGESKKVNQVGKLLVKNGKISIKCDFSVLIDDYKIKVPKSVEDRVAKSVDINIALDLLPK